jgi:hypothetical protein
MLERLVVAETDTQGAFKVGECLKQPIVGRPLAHHVPEALDHLQLGTIAGERIECQMWKPLEHLVHGATVMPGRGVASNSRFCSESPA